MNTFTIETPSWCKDNSFQTLKFSFWKTLFLSISLCLGVGNQSAFAQTTFSATGFPLNIPDPGNLNNTVTVTGLPGTVASADEVQINLNIAHTWASDIVVGVTPPGGTEILIVNRIGGSGNNNNMNAANTLSFRSNAAGVVPVAAGNTNFDIPAGVYLPTGSAGFPVGSFASLVGATRNGNWTIRVRDDDAIIVGTLTSASLTFFTTPPCPTAPSATDDTGTTCSGGGTDDFITWQADRQTAVAGVDNATSVSTVEYSTSVPTSAVPATGNTTVNGIIPAGCAAVTQSITAYMRCDSGTAGDATDDTWTAIGTYTLTVYPAAPTVVETPGGCGVAAKAELICADGTTVLDTKTGTAPDGLPCVGPPASGTESEPLAAGTWTAAEIQALLGATDATCYSDLDYGPVAADCAFEACAVTPTATVDADNADPCFCVTPPVLDATNAVTTVGVLGDVMVITTNPVNTTVVWTVVAGANTTITSGPTHVGSGVYEIGVTYNDNGSGWAVTATPDAANAGLGVQNGAGGTSCTYTIGSFPNLSLGACAGTTVSGATPAGGTYSPTTIAAPAPGSAASTVALTYTYDAHPAVGANPACPLTLNATANLPACPAGCAASANMQWGN